MSFQVWRGIEATTVSCLIGSIPDESYMKGLMISLHGLRYLPSFKYKDTRCTHSSHTSLYFPSASIMEITDANLRKLQESLSSSGTRRQSQPSTSFPPSASASFQRPYGSMHVSTSTPVTQAPPTEFIKEKPNFGVDDGEVNALIPPIPSSFLEIDNMPLSELQQLVDEEVDMDRFLESTSGVKTLMELKQSIETSNVNAAKANLAHEEKIEGLCAETESLKKDLNSKMEQYRKLDAERLALTHPPDLQDAIGELTRAKKDAYRESEELADDWVEAGGANVSDFVKQFMEVRVLYHTRAAKAERLGMSM